MAKPDQGCQAGAVQKSLPQHISLNFEYVRVGEVIGGLANSVRKLERRTFDLEVMTQFGRALEMGGVRHFPEIHRMIAILNAGK